MPQNHAKMFLCWHQRKTKISKVYNKVSIVKTNSGVIVGAKDFRNEYDGHTIGQALQQVGTLTGKLPRQAVVDRGYRGCTTVATTTILIPDKPNKQHRQYQQQKLHKAHRKRAGIEPVIGYLKSDHRLGRNFYKGIFGDNINVMLAAAAFNFKRMMNKWKEGWDYFLHNMPHLIYSTYHRQNLETLVLRVD
jgi:IS5 family transposase